MLYLLTGQDDFSLTRELETIKDGMGDRAMLSLNTTTLDGPQITPDQLKTVCETVPFMAGKRLVIINGLLERFERRRRTGRRKKTAPDNLQEETKPFSACLRQVPDSTVLVLTETRVTNNNPLFQEISDKAVVKSFPLLTDTQLRQWTLRQVAEEASSISDEAVELLTRLIGSNLWIMANEVGKLALFTSGRRIEEADVRAVVSYTQQDNVFAMVDAIIALKAELAERLLQRLLRGGAAPAYLLLMLSRQIRIIVRARELMKQRQPKTEMQRKLGLTSEFVLKKTLEQASRYPPARLHEVYQRLLETDLSIKTGRYSGELALSILVAELCQPPEKTRLNRPA